MFFVFFALKVSSSERKRVLLLTESVQIPPRLSQSPSLLISGSGSWPQLEGRALALSLAFAAENIKKSTAHASRSLRLCLRTREELMLEKFGLKIRPF